MENNIASILFARGIMPDDFISYSTYGAVAEIVKELKQLEAERSELRNNIIDEKLEQIKELLQENERLTKILSECQWYQTDHAQQAKRIEELEKLLGDILAGFQQFGTIYSKDEERIKAALNL